MTWSDIAVLIGALVLLYKTFFSKEERESAAATISHGEADAIKTYEEAASINAQLRKTLDQEISTLRHDLQKAQKDLLSLQEQLCFLREELKKRDEVIQCLEQAYYDLAQQAVSVGLTVDDVRQKCFEQKEKKEKEDQS